MQQITPATPKDSIRAMKILAIAMISGMLMFAVIVLVLNQVSGPAPLDKSIKDILLIAVFAWAIIAFILARMIFNKRIEAARNYNQPLQQKLDLYRAALITYMALCEGAGLFAVILCFLTGDYLSLIVAGAMAIAMYLKFPRKSTIFNDLQLDSKEQMELT